MTLAITEFHFSHINHQQSVWLVIPYCFQQKKKGIISFVCVRKNWFQLEKDIASFSAGAGHGMHLAHCKLIIIRLLDNKLR